MRRYGLEPPEYAFIRAAGAGDAKAVQRLIDSDVDVNASTKGAKLTAMHLAASHDARKTARVIAQSGKYDFLALDHKGQLASDLAYTQGGNPAMSRWLAMIEKGQAMNEGIQLQPRLPRHNR